MGSNKCTLDYFDYFSGQYLRNFYAERNPNVIKELGDVGNDAAVHDSRLFVVVNCSNKVEVIDAYTGIRIGQVDIPNCRDICFYEDKAYVTSYVGPIAPGSDTPKGAVYEVDIQTLGITRKVTVGYQPEEMAIIDGYMYVANSGGYRAPLYDNTLSVIRMSDFRQTKQISVAPNLQHVRPDSHGNLWVSSRGNRAEISPALYILEPSGKNGEMRVAGSIPADCSAIDRFGDRFYYCGSRWNGATGVNDIYYGVIDINRRAIIPGNFITDGTEREIAIPYGLAIHPETGDILLTDAKNYVSSGTLYCFTPDGRKKWSVRTGDIPAHIAFLPRRQQ